jgi:hypothetical protein
VRRCGSSAAESVRQFNEQQCCTLSGPTQTIATVIQPRTTVCTTLHRATECSAVITVRSAALGSGCSAAHGSV